MKSYTLTLTSANTVYKIDTLIKAINPNERGMFASISLQSDPDNATEILIGGANLSTTVYGVRLDPGDSTGLGDSEEFNFTSTLGLYALGVTTAGMTLNIALDER